MHPPAGLAGQRADPLRRVQRRLHIAPVGMGPRMTGLLRDMGALAQPHLILGMHGDAADAIGQQRLQRGVILDQQRAGGGAHEHFHTATAGQPLQAGQVADILRCRPHEEGMVAPGAAARPVQLVGQRILVGGGWLGVRHFEDRRHPAQDRATRTGFQIFLVLVAGLAEMHLGVDHAGQHGQAGGVEDIRRLGLAEIAQRHDAPGADADVDPFPPVRRDGGAAGNGEVEGVGHGSFSYGVTTMPRK